MTIDIPNQVWCADVSYIPMRRGFLYLVAIMGWASCKVLYWRLSNTWAQTSAWRLWRRPWRVTGALRYSTSQFRSFAFTSALKDAGIRISMHGKGRWMDNVMIERLGRALKSECVYLSAFETGSELRRDSLWWRSCSSLDDKTPYEA